jgi:hypothetical protein
VKKQKASYGGFTGGWHADLLHMRCEWRDIIRSIDLTEKQKQAAILVLEFVQSHGQDDKSRTLSHDQRSAKWWPCKFVSIHQLKKHFQDVAKKGELSYRYLWYAVDWLILSGWLDEGKRVERGHAVRGYWFSDRVLKYVKHCESAIPTLWEGS